MRDYRTENAKIRKEIESHLNQIEIKLGTISIIFERLIEENEDLHQDLEILEKELEAEKKKNENKA